MRTICQLPIFIFAVFFTGLTVSQTEQPKQQAEKPPLTQVQIVEKNAKYWGEFKVVKVYDGDTLRATMPSLTMVVSGVRVFVK